MDSVMSRVYGPAGWIVERIDDVVAIDEMCGVLKVGRLVEICLMNAVMLRLDDMPRLWFATLSTTVHS